MKNCEIKSTTTIEIGIEMDFLSFWTGFGLGFMILDSILSIKMINDNYIIAETLKNKCSNTNKTVDIPIPLPRKRKAENEFLI